MRNLFPGLIVGTIFGAGLALSDMVNPARVQAFLDVAGVWDPTLMLVMVAALVPSAIAYLLRRRMTRPLLGDRFSIPESRMLDPQLLIGAATFGVGWGLVGLCPGPAFAGLVLGSWQPWMFVAAMLAGMALHHLFTATRAPAPAFEG
ncbi:MAG: YeeE/YedE family protein [Alphaproteobacteria bacterium]|nr:YeeE/YedE family protein [Alphaproteobacteria bacterium]